MFSNRLPGRFDAQCHKGQLKRGMIGNQRLIDALVTAHAWVSLKYEAQSFQHFLRLFVTRLAKGTTEAIEDLDGVD